MMPGQFKALNRQVAFVRAIEARKPLSPKWPVKERLSDIVMKVYQDIERRGSQEGGE